MEPIPEDDRVPDRLNVDEDRESLLVPVTEDTDGDTTELRDCRDERDELPKTDFVMNGAVTLFDIPTDERTGAPL